MKIKLLFVALLCSFLSWGQTTLYSENFGTTAGTFSTGWTSSNTTNGFSAVTTAASSGYTGASGSVNARFINTGTNGVAHTLTYANSLSTVGYANITVIWGARATATFSQAVTFEWSPDGVTWNPVTYTQVASNATWALVNGGTAITLPVGAEGLSNLRFKFSVTSNNNGNYQIDDFKVAGTTPSSYSGVTAGAGVEPTTISSLTNTEGAASLNFDFTVTDDANTVAADDALPTLISQIVIPQGAGNDIADWTQAILGVALSDGTTTTTTATINAGNITFSGINTATLGNVSDGTTKTYTLKIWLKTALGGTLPDNIDGYNFAFKIDRTNFTTASAATSTQFESGAGTVVESGSTNNGVTVVTTKLTCNTAGATQYINTNFIPTLPIIKAQDANNNLDKNYSSNVTITNTGSLGMTTVPTAFSAGLVSFGATFRYTAAGNGTLTIAENPSAGITDAVSNTITVYNSLVTVATNGAVAASNVTQSTTNVLISTGKLTATYANATLNAAALVTAGTYLAADIQASGFKLLVNTANNQGTATTISTLSSAKVGGNETLNFAFVNQAVNVGTPLYYWITVDVALTATVGRTIRKDITNGADFNYTNSVNKAGTFVAGGDKTIVKFAPEIEVRGNGSIIVDGDTTPIVGDWTNFGTTIYLGSSFTRTFTINNIGPASLSISGLSPYVSITGTNASEFVVTTPPSNSIAAAGTTNFVVTFTPLAIGVRTATITINNNDGYDGVNETVFDFAIQGTGVVSAASDLFYVAGTSPATISSTMNDASPLTISTGVQAMQFQLRDGGATADTDLLGTTLTGFTIAQATNTVSNWLEAIKTIELFDLSTNANVGIGVITATTVTFSGLNIAVADGGTKTLALRMSLNCGIGSNSDNEYFGFSIANATTTTLAGGSSMATFTAVKNLPASSTLIIAVVANQLIFSQQPVTVGMNSPMPSVIVKATDACGNTDKGFTGVVTLTSSGTMTGTPITATAVGGVATFNSISHSALGTNLTLDAASSLPTKTSGPFDITVSTAFVPGDLAVIAVNTNIGGSGLDQIAVVCFKDILPGTTMFITDNGYEREYAGEWGGTEGVVTITRIGSTLTKGTIIVFESSTANVTNETQFEIYVCGVVDTNWTKSALSGAGIGGFNLNSNDDLYIMQGGSWTNSTSHHSTYSGNVLYGWTESGWQTAPSLGTCNSISGSPDNCTAWSTLYPFMNCFNTLSPVGAGKVKFDDPNNPDFSLLTNGRFDWIALINNTANWVTYADNTAYNAGGYDYKNGCAALTIAPNTYVNGKWSGRKDTNWFNCVNWDTLSVPDETVNVEVGDNIFNNQAKIDATATYAIDYGGIAKANNLTIIGEKVEIVDSLNNKLEVHGNLLIDTVGVNSGDLDMDGGTATDGQLYLYGNWTNNVGNAAFEEGHGTVQFVGTSPQVISTVAPVGTETFYNVILDNDFDTAVSNDLLATGDLTINSGRNVSIDSNGYIQASKKLNHNGNLTIENNGQFIQVDETDANTGTYSGTKFQVKRTAQVKHLDYVYWGSPTDNFQVNSLPNSNRYEWDTLFPNANGTKGTWVNPSTATMTKGKGYIARASNGASSPQPMTVIFNDKPHNGQFTFPINRGTFTGADYDADPSNATNVWTTKQDDNWNLVGNPYPSAIDAEAFLVLNQTKIEGAVWIWKHGLDPTSSSSPFYQNYLYNYSATSDLIKYNGLGSSDPDTFAGSIGSGQGFFVNMLDIAPQPGSTITFRNDLRKGSTAANGLYDNTDFYRNSINQANDIGKVEEKSRIWLDIVNTTTGSLDRALVGYSTHSTLGKDHLYDCFNQVKSDLTLYSLIDNDPYIIQGRPLPFDQTDIVPLGIKIANAGNHTIAIKKVDGLFSQDQNIYLQDKYLNIIHDLKNEPYTFIATIGRFDDRFVLRYTTELLQNDHFGKTENKVFVFANKNEINISSIAENISEIIVYDLLGRTLFQRNGIDEKNFSISSIVANQQVLMVKVKLKNSQTITKKIIF